MQIKTYSLRRFLTLLIIAGSVSAVCAEDAYIVEEQGRGTLRAIFDRNMHTPEEQWEYARSTQNKGWLGKASRRMLYLVRRWPNSKEAPWAARARADMLMAGGSLEDAFEAYQYLIDNYSSRMADYDAVLESQFEIAVKIMNRRRMRWMMGGFRAPEYSIDYFEKIILNGPQWQRASEAQFMIGQCHEESGALEMAIVAYGLLGYRYPDSAFTERAAWRQIVCMREMQDEYPNSPEMLERLLTSTTVFLSSYPASDHKAAIVRMRNELYEVKAGAVYNKATFYAEVPRKPEAAILYDQALIEEYPKSKLVPRAKERITELEALLARPEEEMAPVAPRSKPLPFG